MPHKITRAYKDVHSTIFFKGCSPIKDVTIYVRAAHKVEGQNVHCPQWCFSAYDGSKFLYFAAKCHLEIQTAFGIFRSTKERRRPYHELGHSDPWQPGENLQLTKGKKTIECCTEHFGIPRRGHKAIGCSIVGYESKPRQRKPRARKRSEETMFKFLEPFSKMWSTTMQHISENLFQLKQMLEETLLRKHLLFLVTDAGGDPRAKGKTESVIREKQSQRFRTKRRITTCSRTFQKDPSCDVCRMTTRARCEKQTSETRRLDLTSNLIQRTITEHYTILNLHDGSRNDQRNALIVQSGCSCWLQGYPTKKQRRARSSILLDEISGFIPEAWESPHRQFKGVHQSVSGSAVDSCVKNALHLSDANKITERAVPRVTEGTPTARVQSGLPEVWWDRAMECLSYVRNAHNKMPDGKTASDKICGVTFARPLIPLGAKVSYKPIS